MVIPAQTLRTQCVSFFSPIVNEDSEETAVNSWGRWQAGLRNARR